METPPHESRTVKALRLTARQALMEQRNFWRSPEYALFTFALPLFLLLLLGAANGGSYLPGHIRQIKVLVPSILAFGVIAAAYANLGAKMAVLRHDGVLKRIRTTPLPSGAYLIGLIVSTVLTSLAIAGCTALAGWLAFGTAPRLDGMFLLGFGLALGIVCFAALGLAVSSLIKSAESASPITNAIYLPVVMISGIFDPTIGLPRWMSAGASALPIKALAEVLEDAYTPAAHAFPGRGPGDAARLGGGGRRVHRLALPLAARLAPFMMARVSARAAENRRRSWWAAPRLKGPGTRAGLGGGPHQASAASRRAARAARSPSGSGSARPGSRAATASRQAAVKCTVPSSSMRATPSAWAIRSLNAIASSRLRPAGRSSDTAPPSIRTG